MVKVEDSDQDQIIISTYKQDGLIFSVGISSSTGKIMKIFLPKKDEKKNININSKEYADFEVSSEYEELAKKISKIYAGEKVDLNLNILDLEVHTSNNKSLIKTHFMRDVLLQTYKIPFGEVRTYKYIAEKLGTVAYRAVGTALRKNPYPLIIPCHRVVKSDLTIGQYVGGSRMKKELLEKEGIPIKRNMIVKDNKFP